MTPTPLPALLRAHAASLRTPSRETLEMLEAAAVAVEEQGRLQERMQGIEAVAAKWEREAAELRAPFEDHIIKDGYGELWPDMGYQAEYGVLMSRARELRAALVPAQAEPGEVGT